MNNLKISPAQYNSLLALFPEAWHEKLKLYTGEELYYSYRLCMFQAKRDKTTGDHRTGDITFAMLRSKLLRYLKGELTEYGRPCQPIYPSAWEKIGRKFRHDFDEQYLFIEPIAERAHLDALASQVNAKRIA